MIDLTDDNAPLEPHQSRKIPRPLDGQPFSQSQRDTWVNQEDEEEDDADHVIILSQDGDNSATESFELYGKEKSKKRRKREKKTMGQAIGKAWRWVVFARWSGTNLCEAGVLSTKIVGIQYYKGYATEGEYVIIRREPSNPVCAPGIF